MSYRVPHNVKLNARQRAIIDPRYVEGQTHAEIAARVGISTRAVCKRDAGIVAAFRAAGNPPPRVPGRYAVRSSPLRLAGC